MLDARELHDAARDPDGPVPAAFADICDHIATLQAALDRAMAERDQLIRDARRVGVPFDALARWTGVGRRRLDQIAHGR